MIGADRWQMLHTSWRLLARRIGSSVLGSGFAEALSAIFFHPLTLAGFHFDRR